MHVLIAILAGIASLLWVITYLMRSASELPEAARDVKNTVRRHRWSKKNNATILDILEDPRDAAAILMAQISAYDGEITARQKDRMKQLMAEAFAADEETAEGLYSFGRMAIGQINDAANSLRKILAPVSDRLTPDEMKEFVQMLEEMAEVENPPTERQRQLIMEVRRGLALEG